MCTDKISYSQVSDIFAVYFIHNIFIIQLLKYHFAPSVKSSKQFKYSLLSSMSQ